jgi:hypothetical protein
VSRPPATDELRMLEEARFRLEAALAGDENWRALTRAPARGAADEMSEAHRARNKRLEMALAGNEFYQAWKHLNGAIEALRIKRLEDAQAQGWDDAGRAPDEMQQQVAASAAVADAMRALPPRLMRRLEALERQQPDAQIASSPPARPGDSARPQRSGRKVKSTNPEPPEATVTFVVRATTSPSGTITQTTGGSDEGSEPSWLERRRGQGGGALERHDGAQRARDVEEAEVTILTPEGLEEQRKAEEEAGVVSPFRKVLSGE